MKQISIDAKVIEVINQYPEIVDTLVEIGFTHLGDPVMLARIGDIMTLRKAINHHNLKFSDVEEKLNEDGFTIKEDISNE